ncbi:hypothetical protein XENOCAPTIV_000294 [Xenoophorus captivus]|uniref:AH domain-containing protein n=1 Tax=Xenoophorus captivus TaxID=1517983 RepID=A0ABV0R5X8_9TELE
MEASEEIKDSEASNATQDEVTPPKVGCHEDVCSEEKPECELSETEKKKMMEALGEKGDVSAASNTTEEDKNPPKCTRQALAEKLGRGSRTVDLDLEPRLELLKDDRQRYDHMAKLAQTLANQFAQFSFIQKTLGDTFNELSVKSKDLHVEFGMNAEAQRFLSKSTGILQSAINSFTFDMNTLVNKTIEDTMINAKQYEAARWAKHTHLAPFF